MFSKIIKEFFLKKLVNKKLTQHELNEPDGKIMTIGILVDETYFENKEDLYQQFVFQGFLPENIVLLSFKNKYKTKEIVKEPYFSLTNVGLSGRINKKEVQDFIKTPFDMLVSYYDERKAPLMLVTKQSKAKFKVGFSSVDKRMFHLMIASQVEKQEEFTSELFKYLRILNKI